MLSFLSRWLQIRRLKKARAATLRAARSWGKLNDPETTKVLNYIDAQIRSLKSKSAPSS